MFYAEMEKGIFDSEIGWKMEAVDDFVQLRHFSYR
jgi:hypothetical protein